ncbi:DTW protein [Dillenia turbinata]|uniref:tRNA-uridine aminocarboxypropyltransferase n=1 Tax=Dillenia turbinata TaxID=194707 RepID=A0AAN8Z053_9MAGN
MLISTRTLFFKCSLSQFHTLSNKTLADYLNRPATRGSIYSISSSSSSSPRSSTTVIDMGDEAESPISLEEWQAWGTTSPLPAMVGELVQELKGLERDSQTPLIFGGLGGKLKGDMKIQEDKKHRATYEKLGESEEKLHFFSSRQVACRVIGSRGYLCQKCWLPTEDCMCLKVVTSSLWPGIRFWLYMHPKDFLRQNNTGKLLWQVFGVQAATMCIYGIAEHEEIMWNTFKLAGKSKVWCLYPNKNALTKSVQDINAQEVCSEDSECSSAMRYEDKILNFILIDGTWSNSAAMFKRLKERAKSVWGDDEIPCITLATGASAMHKLRPQPSWDRTCTAAAAVSLLYELQTHPQFCFFELDKPAEALGDALAILLEALIARRVRMGRSITRKERHKVDIC